MAEQELEQLEGTVEDIKRNPNSITGRYLRR